MSAERYHLGPLTGEQLAGLQNAVCRVKVDLQRAVAVSAARADNAAKTGDAELELLAQDVLRENRELLLKLESVMPVLFSAESSSQRRFARAAAPRKARR